MNYITTDKTSLELKQIFSRAGISQIIIFDNCNAFISAAFSNFCSHHGIQHIRTPFFLHSQSNRQVDTFKKGLIKNNEETITQEILEIFLIGSSATSNPNTSNGNSLAGALLNHKVRCAYGYHPSNSKSFPPPTKKEYGIGEII